MVLGWLIRFLVVMVLVRLAWKFLTGFAQGATTRPQAPPTKTVALVRDPACGTYIDRSRAMTLRHNGVTHHFCSEDCRTGFQQGRRAAKGV